MKITSVTYRTNRPTVGSKYIHQHVEATARVGKNETAAQALEKLKAEVHSLLYPELVNLCKRVAAVSPLVAKRLADLSEEQVAELYGEHAEAFRDLLKGDMAPSVFIDEVLG